jgi:hypothetical protein
MQSAVIIDGDFIFLAFYETIKIRMGKRGAPGRFKSLNNPLWEVLSLSLSPRF